jgi:uncharacterized protein
MVRSSYDKPPVLFIQFARAPVLGSVKTRLRPAISSTQALALHLQLLRRTAITLLDSGLAEVELWLSDSSHHPDITALAAKGLPTRVQSGEGLGQRMCAAISAGLSGADKVVLVGSDCPGIDSNYLKEALAELETNDVVLGPASDGGYVLIAARRCSHKLFANVNWGSEWVLQQTISNLETLGWTYSLLEVLDDIDRPEDLALLATFGMAVSDE